MTLMTPWWLLLLVPVVAAALGVAVTLPGFRRAPAFAP